MKNEKLHNKQNPFKVPENYFENFENRMLDKVKNNNTVTLPKHEGFSVPEDYFDNVTNTILAKTIDQPTKKNNHNIWYYAISSVAAIAIVAFSIISFSNNKSTINSVASTELENYINNGYMPFSSYDIGEVFEEELDTVTVEIDIDDDSIIDYLSDYAIVDEP